jgi:hypothetical protein
MTRSRVRARAWAIGLLLAAGALLTAAEPGGPLPAIVFVSRLPPAGADSGQVPGLGPHGTFAGRGGRLRERASDGGVRDLLPAGRLFDAADPAVSADGARVAFSARETARSRWRIWSVARSGGEPRCLTCDTETQGDDADPLWWGDTLLFVSTRGGGRALYDGAPRTQLWALPPSGPPVMLTHEPNGVLDPAASPAGDRVWYARWWFNPWRADARGLTRSGAAAPDSVNQWQAVSARLTRAAAGVLALDDVRIAAGGALPRRRGMALQPAPLRDGGAFAVAARNMGLAPTPGPLAVLRFPAPVAAGTRWSGAALADRAGDRYAAGSNLAPPGALAPAPLADGRLVCSLDPGGRGEFGLCLVSADGDSHEMLVDVPGEWELDPVVVPTPRPMGSARTPGPSVTKESAAATARARTREFRYLSSDVFAGEGAPERRDDAELHVYRLLARDAAERIRKVAVPRSGRVDIRLPADTPLFEVLVARGGQALATPHGPAQVLGFNSGAPGTTSRCSGCHLGHSLAK